MMRDQKLFKLQWHTLLRRGGIIVTSICAHNGDQDFHYVFMLGYRPVIILDKRAKIVDTSWTLIARIG